MVEDFAKLGFHERPDGGGVFETEGQHGDAEIGALFGEGVRSRSSHFLLDPGSGMPVIRDAGQRRQRRISRKALTPRASSQVLSQPAR